MAKAIKTSDKKVWTVDQMYNAHVDCCLTCKVLDALSTSRTKHPARVMMLGVIS